MRRAWLVVLYLSLGCASAPPKAPVLDQAALADADAKVLQGCYDCLLEAHATYERAASGRWRPLVAQRLFETDLLIALREREFDLPPSGALERARAVAAGLPAAVEAGRFLELVARVPPEHGTWDRKALQVFRTANQYTPSAAILDDLVWLSTGILAEPVRRYLGMTLFCAYPTARRRARAAATRRSRRCFRMCPSSSKRSTSRASMPSARSQSAADLIRGRSLRRSPTVFPTRLP
jgi:hypothetical protein